jgi:multiple antibiotic resistance protein
MIIDELLKFFVLLFVVVEPVTLVPVFASLTVGASEGYKRKMSLKAVLISGGVLALFALAGAGFISMMGISIDAFRIAGGVMLFLIALEMVFARESGTKITSEEKIEVTQRADISVFPLAFPFIAGPGALATVLLTFGTARDDYMLTLGLLGVIALVLAITLALLLLAPFVNRVMGVTGAHVVSRLAGVVLAALAVQFMIDGLKGALA